MKKEYFLITCSSVAAALLVLGVINWLAPQLLGLPRDLQLVSVDRSVPPFYTGVFRKADYESAEFMLQDPLTRVRPHPLMSESLRGGPSDLLGFRNRSIPDLADVVVIGDSQTYGNNALLENNWPTQMDSILRGQRNRTYSMAAGGWGAVQYRHMFSKALLFRPRVVIVAFYTGNDPLESFQMVYGNPNWSGLIPDPQLDIAAMPRVAFPAPESEWWRVEFADGIHTVFTPLLRLASNQPGPATGAGYRIIRDVAGYLAEVSKSRGTQLVLTVIPTKELVYRDRIQAEGLAPPEAYRRLVEHEAKRIEQLEAHFRALPGVHYTDVVKPLQQAAMGPVALYPRDINAHPVAAGYRVIAAAVAAGVRPYLKSPLEGIYAFRGDDGEYRIMLANESGGWIFASGDLVRANGWSTEGITVLAGRDLAGIPIRGYITAVDRARFGPS